MKQVIFCMAVLLGTCWTYAENLALRLPYQIVAEIPLAPGATANYLDSPSQPRLTDGRIGENWMHGTVVGWLDQGRVRVSFDLQTEQEVASVRCHVMGGGGSGVFFPPEIRLYGRNSGAEEMLLASTSEHPVETGGQATAAWMILEPRSPVKTRFLELEMTPSRPGAHLMADEIEFYAKQEPREEETIKRIPDFYPAELLSVSRFGLGFVYFGATSLWVPENHMLKMRSLGFNAVHSECNTAYGGTRWKNLNPEQGVFCWDSLDHWLVGVTSAGLITPIMIGLEGGIPPWLMEKYPEAAFINPYGETVPGLIDFGHPEVLESVCQYLRVMARRYANSENIAGYIIGDEYSLYQNYYHKNNFFGQNFNVRMKTAFQQYLREKYASIEELNQRFGRQYEDFTGLEPSLSWITGREHEPEWAEWCRFRELESARIYSAMREAIHQEDSTAEIALSAVASVWPYHSVSGVNLKDFPWLDAFGQKVMTKDTPQAVAECGISGRLIRGIGRSDKKLWVTNLSYHGYPNSESAHVRGLAELMGAGVKLATYFLWDIQGGKDRWVKDAKWIEDSPCFLYLDKDKNYVEAEELNILKRLNVFMSHCGEWIARAKPSPSSLGILVPLDSYHHEFRNILTAAYLEKTRYPKHPQLNEASYVAMMAMARFANRENLLFEGTVCEHLERFQAVSATGNTWLSENSVVLLQDFVRRGGLLFADEKTGTFDELGIKRSRPFSDYFTGYEKQLLLINPKQLQDEEARLTNFLDKVRKVRVSAGGLALLVSEESCIAVLTNRGAYTEPLSGVELRISDDLLPPEPFRVYRIEPGNLPEKEISFLRDGAELVLANLSCKDALVIGIFHGDQPAKDFPLPDYKRKSWWNSDWQFRVPVRLRTAASAQSFAADLDITALFSAAGIDQLPALDSLCAVKYTADGSAKTVPVVVLKDKQFNLYGRYRFRALIQDHSAKPDSLGFCHYDLYLSTRDAPSEKCLVRENFWCEQDALHFVNGGTGKKVSVSEETSGMTLHGLPAGEYDVLLIGKNTELHSRLHQIAANGKQWQRTFTNYPRQIRIPDVPVQNQLRLIFSDFQEIQLDEIHLLTKNAEAKSIPQPQKVLIGTPEERNTDHTNR